MDQKTYLEKFSRSVRWRLPKQEAAEVLADYEELLSQRPEERNSSLLEDLGDPRKAAALLTSSRAYRRWMASFGAMAVCLLVPLSLLLRSQFRREPTTGMWFLFLLGIVLSFLWFRPRTEGGKEPLPRKILSALGILLLSALCSGAILGGLAAEAWKWIPPGLYGTVGRMILLLAGLTAACAAAYGLVKARMEDRRWCALYVMGLMVLIECVFVLSLLTGMDLSTTVPGWWVEYVVRWCVLGGVGLAAAGGMLC